MKGFPVRTHHDATAAKVAIPLQSRKLVSVMIESRCCGSIYGVGAPRRHPAGQIDHGGTASAAGLESCS
ncbi:hypothetical protein MAAFP003_2247 [Mycobacterium ahvazicum]|uniref:Uncharacterized protein n=1 Tax=Mycobacterium ahvazicum TaxID=1964395 RepID=A0A2K4Y9X1_9MYCO|nr:hypothetical protein MAAFP003_2247 [Mycobacterium ahvazicum]